MARKISNILNTLFLENANAITFEYNPETGSASFLSCDSENKHISKTVKDFFGIDLCKTLKIHPEDCAMIQGKLLEASRTPTKQASLVFRLNYFTPQYQYHQIQYASTALNNNPHRCRIIAIITNIQTQFQQKLVHDELAMSISNLPKDIGQGLPVSQQVFEILYRTTDTHLAISSILGVLGRAFHTDRVYIFEDSEDHSTCSNTYEWCAAGISAEKDNLQNLSYHDDLGDKYHDNFSEEGIFLCQDTRDLPKEQRDILEPQGVKSMLQCAITENGIFSGYIGFDSCSELRHWSDDQVRTLMQATRVLGTFLSKSRRESKIIESNRMFREMLDLIPGGIVVFQQKPNGFSLVYLNSGYYSLFGLSHDRLSKPIIDDFLGPIHPDDLELIRSRIFNSTSDSPLIDITYRVHAKGNEFKWIRIDGNMTTDQRNGIRYLYCICTDINEKMKQQEALERDKALLNLAIKAAKMNWWEYDAETHAIHYEDNKFSSYDVPELLIEKKIIHPSSAEDATNLFKELSELKEGSRQADIQLLDDDLGTYVWKKIIITPRFDMNLSRIMYLGTSIDITEQKRLKDNYMMQIHDLENFSAQNLIAKARYCLSNDSLEYWHQSENSIDFDGLNSFDGGKLKTAALCVDPNQKQAFLSIFEKKRLLADYANGTTDVAYEYWRASKNGSRFWCRTQAKLFSDPSTNDVMCFICTYDMNEIKLQQELIANVVNNNYDYLAIIDMKKKNYFMYNKNNVNDEVLPPTQSQDYEAEVRRFSKDLLRPEDQKRNIQEMSIENIRTQLGSSDRYTCYASVVRKDSSIARKMLQFSYIDKTNEIVLLSRIDITESSLLEQQKMLELQKAKDEAESARIAAEQASIVKAQFLSSMSHDLRTPMNAIIGLSSLAKDELNNPKAMASYVSNISSAAKFLLGLVNECLDYEKLSTHKVKLVPEPYSYDEFIHNIKSIIQPLCDQKRITLVFGECGNHATILADHIRFEQIFLNLLSNSVKFTPEGGTVKLLFDCGIECDSLLPIRITVQDNGIGISPSFQEHLFEPFMQEGTSSKGTGLGLSIVKTIVDLMGGSISFDSKQGVGTSFFVDLSLPIAPDHPSSQNEKSSSDDASIKGARILLAEDHPLNTEIATKLLERRFASVTCAANGEEALKLFRDSPSHSFDAILMDIRMPVMDGYEATRAIRALERIDSKSIPIIAMSANAFDEDIRMSLECGMNAHLSKPIEPDKLYQTLSHWISAKP